MEHEQELKFQPLTDGLGFHPFSDGLPYAPVSKTREAGFSQGAGAVSAGAPRFVFPTPSPQVAPVAPASPATSAPQLQRRAEVRRDFEKAAPQHLIEPAKPGVLYLFKRVLAYLLDTIFNTALCTTALSMALWRLDIEPEVLFSPGVILGAVLFLIAFNWALIVAEEIAFGTSVGKRVFGLALEGSVSAIFLRAFFFLPSLGFFGLGLVWALFNSERRCWHDLAVDLQPIEVARI